MTEAEPAPQPEAGEGGEPTKQWVPAEFASGMTRFKDTGVYVDGKLVAVLAYGELPETLQAVWLQEKVSAPKEPGDPGPGWTWKKVKRYRFTDYLRELGLDVEAIKEIHVHGPKSSEVIIASGEELRSKLGEGFMFRFGGDESGKALPVVPPGFGNKKSPDKIVAVTVYVKKKPPVLVRNVGLILDGERVDGIAYYGEPMRGGLRVYLDRQVKFVIKRRQLSSVDTETPGRWKLAELLEAEGVDVSSLVEAWLVFGEKRHRKLTPEELRSATLISEARSKPVVVVGDEQLRLDVLALRTTPLDLSKLEKIENEDEGVEPFRPEATLGTLSAVRP